MGTSMLRPEEEPAMSVDETLVTASHFRYIAERTTPEDAFLRDLRQAAVREGIPPISIGPAQGAFLQILLRLRGARDVVEVGTLAGYSAIYLFEAQRTTATRTPLSRAGSRRARSPTILRSCAWATSAWAPVRPRRWKARAPATTGHRSSTTATPKPAAQRPPSQ